jgi:hypothetical protein
MTSRQGEINRGDLKRNRDRGSFRSDIFPTQCGSLESGQPAGWPLSFLGYL